MPPLRDRLWPFLGGIARQNGMKAIEIAGMPDHVHILLSLPSTLSIAKPCSSLRAALPNGCMRLSRSTGSSVGR
jgi:REP element-mobilizing transposase RayT